MEVQIVQPLLIQRQRSNEPFLGALPFGQIRLGDTGVLAPFAARLVDQRANFGGDLFELGHVRQDLVAADVEGTHDHPVGVDLRGVEGGLEGGIREQMLTPREQGSQFVLTIHFDLQSTRNVL